MGISSMLGLGAANTRILKRYGVRSGSIINATGTGTQVSLYLNNYSRVTEGVSEIFNEDNKLYITALSPNGTPVRPHSVGLTEVRRSLTGRLITFRRYPSIDIDITVIGNSLDYYKLSMLATFYLKRGVKSYIPVIVDEEAGEYGEHVVESKAVPLLNMDLSYNSAPGAIVTLSGGVMTDGDTLLGVEGNSRISDRTFSFSFAAATPVSWSRQYYDPTQRPSLLEQLTGIEII